MATPSALIGGRYRLVRELGRGGMSVVWEAQDERLDRVVAVKQLHIQPGLTEPEARIVAERAMREARIHARLHHPHVVTVFDVVEYENQPALVMELVPSQTLAEILREQGPMEAGDAARIGSQVASALAAAHALGIVHRDVKPSNILIGEDGRARLSDFGISRAFGDTTLTGTGMVNGTPAYLAPEVALGNESTPAADVFSLGSTLYAVLEGGPPFGTEGNAIALLHKVAQADIPTPERAGDLAPLLASMLAKDPDVRPSMEDVGTTLSTLTGGSATPTTEEDTGVSTVAIAPPTGARPAAGAAEVAAGAVAGAGALAGGVATASAGGTVTASAAQPDSPTAVLPASEADAATPRLVSPTQAAPIDAPPAEPPPSVGEPIPDPGPPNRRRSWIAGVAAVVVLLAAVTVAGLLWPRAAPPGPSPNTTVVPAQTGRSEQRSESPTGDETNATETEANNPRETRATEDASETRGNEESSREPTGESSESREASESPNESSKSSESSKSASEPTQTQSGDGDNSGNGDGEGGDDNSGEGGDG